MMAAATNPGMCVYCGQPFDDHRLPHIHFPSDKPVCPPKKV